jgi:hypothetical protein
MARKILFISLVGIIGSALLFGLKNSGPSITHAQENPLDAATEQRILRATVQITMVREEIQETVIGATSETKVLVSRTPVVTVADGIGTLVSFEGEVVLVTHNHWPQVVDYTKPDGVQFHNAQGEWLLEIDGVEFQHNILYRDGGTLVMRAPEALVSQLEPIATVGDNQNVVLGDVVHVVRHEPGSETQVGFLAAQVTAVNEDGQHSVMTLQSANGQSIEPGDSGGGIWSDGALVGNMWMTIREEWRYPDKPEETTMVVTDRSRAAGLTASLLDMLEQSLVDVQATSALSDGLVMD